MKKWMASALVVGVLSAVGSKTFGQDKPAPVHDKPSAHKTTHVIFNPSDMKWGDAPPIFPPGSKMAVLQGDPGKPGVYTVRLKAGDGYKIAPHWHATTENITVISGTFYLGTGDKYDESAATAMVAGAFASMPAKMHHYAWFKGETEIQVHGVGPFTLTYVNPADDPTKTAAKK
jgi:hypothetical protein